MDINDVEAEGSHWRTLVIRVWTEAEHDHGFRARLVLGGPSAQPSVLLASDPEQVVTMVRAWLSASENVPAGGPE